MNISVLLLTIRIGSSSGSIATEEKCLEEDHLDDYDIRLGTELKREAERRADKQLRKLKRYGKQIDY